MEQIKEFINKQPKWVKIAALFGGFALLAFMIHFGVSEPIDANLNK